MNRFFFGRPRGVDGNNLEDHSLITMFLLLLAYVSYASDELEAFWKCDK